MNEFKMNDIAYLVRGGTVAKCKIEEVIFHYTQTNLIKKYIVHAYGVEGYITLDEDDLYCTLESAKTQASQYIEDVYKKSVENIENSTEEMFEDMESKLKEKKSA